jgi:hypothetical protein
MRQRWAALAAVAALVTATLVAAASPVAAANTETFLDGVAGVGDVAAGDGRVFVAALDRVVVADAAGAVTGAITGLPGAMGLALSADGGRLYVALSDTAEVAEVDTAALEITRRVSIAPNDCPTHLSLAGDRLWVGYGCYGQWSGGVDTFDVSAASPTVTSVVGSSYGARWSPRPGRCWSPARPG